MATITQETRFDLAKREIVAITSAKEYALHCDAGEIWITANGAAGDVVLRAGESWIVPNDAEVVVSAFQASTATLRRVQALGSLPDGARRMLASLRHWQFPPLAAFPVQFIR